MIHTQVAFTTLPVIADVEIHIDSEGRYCLNDLHKASGLGEAKEPNRWLRLEHTRALIAELKKGTKPVVSTHGGINPGVYAHELLSVSYAGWISAPFQLKVNQAFIDYRMGKLQSVRHVSDPTIAILIQALQEIDQLKQTVPEQKAEKYQEKAYVGDPWEELIQIWLDLRGDTPFTISDVLLEALNIEKGQHTRSAQTRAGNVLRRMGYKSKAKTLKDRIKIREYHKV